MAAYGLTRGSQLKVRDAPLFKILGSGSSGALFRAIAQT
jgi:hypothetical protein